jgi:gluconokinase
MTPPPSTGPERSAVTVIIVMGVAGSGKTTVGTALAVALGWRFVDADDHHTAASIAKMARGEPLDDADRWPWLDGLRAIVAEALAGGVGLVLACSALKGSYRARLVDGDAGGRVRFVYLAGTAELFRARLAQRPGHFMKSGMLDSQLAAFEPPRDALSMDASLPVPTLVARIRTAFPL